MDETGTGREGHPSETGGHALMDYRILSPATVLLCVVFTSVDDPVGLEECVSSRCAPTNSRRGEVGRGGRFEDAAGRTNGLPTAA